MAEIAPREDVYLLKCDLNFKCGHCKVAMCSIFVLMFLKALGLSFACSMGAVTKVIHFSLN